MPPTPLENLLRSGLKKEAPNNEEIESLVMSETGLLTSATNGRLTRPAGLAGCTPRSVPPIFRAGGAQAQNREFLAERSGALGSY
jgi:hypothetical protein